jgi:hypothetical protein
MGFLSAPENRIALIDTVTLNGSTNRIILDAFRMLCTGDRVRTLIAPASRYLDALKLIRALKVGDGTTSINRITLAGIITWHGDTGVTTTLGMFAAPDKGSAFVGTRALDRDASISCTDGMFLNRAATHELTTLILTPPLQ